MLGQAERLYEINSLLPADSTEKSGPKIITFTSGKGGTGKTFLSSNMALNMAQSGKRVLLIDLDINLANIGTLFNASSKKGIYNFLTYNSSLEDIIYNQQENLDLILGESGKIDHPELSEEKVKILIRELDKISSNYDIIVIDTSSGIDSGTLQLLIRSDEVILVTSPEPTSVMDAYVIFKMLKNYGSSNYQNVIVNKVLELNEGKTTFQNLEMATKHFLQSKINYLGEISFSTDVMRSIQDQSIFMKSEKKSQIYAQIKLICDKLRIHTNG